MLIALNGQLNRWRAEFGYGYWSLSAWVKYRVKRAVSFVSGFEEAVSHDCRQRGFDGVVCGHIHHAEITDYDDIRYMNCGDWVESCTALVEDERGEFKLIRWADEMNAAAKARYRYRRRAAAARLKLLLVTDAWEPQTNGVVTTLKQVIPHLNRRGVDVAVVHPGTVQNDPATRLPRDSRRARCVAHRSPHSRGTHRTRFTSRRKVHWALRHALFLTRRSIPFCDFAAHQVPRIRFGAHRIAVVDRLRVSALVPRAGRVDARYHYVAQSANSSAGGCEHLVVWGRGVDTALFTPRRRTPRDRPQAAVRRPNRGRKEPRGVSRVCNSTRRRWSSVMARRARNCSHAIRTSNGPAIATAHDLAAYYADADVFVFPVAHRHVRPGDARSNVVRNAGGRVSGHRSGRTSSWKASTAHSMPIWAPPFDAR